MTIEMIEFVAPRAVAAGELVMDPNTGAWGYARTHYAGGQRGQFAAGYGFVVELPGAPPPGALLFCRGGVIVDQAAAPGDTPCAEVVSVLERAPHGASVLIRLL